MKRIKPRPLVSSNYVRNPRKRAGGGRHRAALVEKATGVSPLFVGKPNPFMMRAALNYIEAHSDETVMIGDRMDTDIIAGVESGLRTILVLTGVTAREEVSRFPYQPSQIVETLAEIDISKYGKK